MKLALLALAFLAGCGSITLRPVQRDHSLRLREVRERLATDDLHLRSVLSYSQEQCDHLDGQVTAWTATAIVVGVLGGGSGVGAIFTDSTPRYVVGGVGAAFAGVSALSAYLSAHYSQKYARGCAVNTGGQ